MKPRRDITLGEMQDECKKHDRDRKRKIIDGECVATECPMMGFCPFNGEVDAFSSANLTDPPRFNEQQMALLKGFYEIGIRTIERLGYAMWATQDASGNYVSIVNKLGLEENETLDLSELLGKEGENK
jgi:hypothetical protein